jgi:hypothetical protein
MGGSMANASWLGTTLAGWDQHQAFYLNIGTFLRVFYMSLQLGLHVIGFVNIVVQIMKSRIQKFFLLLSSIAEFESSIFSWIFFLKLNIVKSSLLFNHSIVLTGNFVNCLAISIILFTILIQLWFFWHPKGSGVLILTWDILLFAEWQVWPVSCTYGAAGGYVVGLMISLLLFLADCVRIPPKPVASNQMFILNLHGHR